MCRACFKVSPGDAFCDEHSIKDDYKIKLKAGIQLSLVALMPVLAVYLFLRIGNYCWEYAFKSLGVGILLPLVLWGLIILSAHIRYWVKVQYARLRGRP